MTKIVKSIEIGVPVEKVFEKCDDPYHFPFLYPYVTNVDDVRKTDKRIGDAFRVTYKMRGDHVSQNITYVEYAPNRRIRWQVHGDIKGSISIALEPQGNSTKASSEADLEMSGSFLKRAVGNLVIERAFSKDSEEMLENLKKLCEAGVQPRATIAA